VWTITHALEESFINSASPDIQTTDPQAFANEHDEEYRKNYYIQMPNNEVLKY
jgi:hypothetical protein